MSKGAGSAALSALAAGTFLYVAVMEVIPKELSGAHTHASPLWLRATQLARRLLGFGALARRALRASCRRLHYSVRSGVK